MQPTIRTGSYVGDAAAQNIELGFVPDYVLVWNETDGDTKWEWFSGMTDTHALQSINNGTTQFSRITADGISAYPGTEGGDAAGFSVGTALSENTKTFRYMATRNAAGG